MNRRPSLDRPARRRRARLLRAAAGLAVCGAVLALTGPPAGAGARTPQAAKPLDIKISTLAPEGSPWYDIIKELGNKWRTASGGKVTLTMFAGGVQGDEPEMIRKMRRGQLQAAAVTSTGLETISPELSALSIPLLFNTNEEVDYVREKIGPRLKKALEDKGFIVLNWGDAGWVRFFSVKPATTINDLRKMKLFTWGAETEGMYKDAGFNPVPLSPTDMLPSFTTGAITAAPSPPLLALTGQWFKIANHMTDLKFAPIVGATIVLRSTWDKIDPGLRPTLLASAEALGVRLKADIRKLEEDAIAAMVKRGLVVHKVSPEAEREWRQTAERFYGRIRGELIPPRDFDEVLSLVKEYRAKNPGK
jgi:TRAP-type C4-dicarboxylate transport system substrate-binding protein